MTKGVAWLLSSAACWAIACSHKEPEQALCTQDAGLALYAERIEPLLTDERPKICNQCHLSGIDLGLFVRDTPCRTMACMRERGLVDFESPEQSKVLGWIRRAMPQSELITQEVIDQEYDAFRSWIEVSAKCGAALCTDPGPDPCGDDTTTDAGTRGCGFGGDLIGRADDPGDCDDHTLEQLFAQQVYIWRERCFPCHFEHDDRVPVAPKWLSTGLSAGAADPAVVCKAGALETMRTVVRRGYINLEDPAASYLLLKPLSPEYGGVVHGGQAKFAGMDDPAYVDFRSWIERYAACAQQNPELPRPERDPTHNAPLDAGPESPILAYCNCMLVSCHGEFHALWGATDEEALGGCRAAALEIPSAGQAAVSGNFLECRLRYCQLGDVSPQSCAAAAGGDPCVGGQNGAPQSP